MAHEDPKVRRAKSLGFVSQACIEKRYGGRPSEEARAKFNRPSYQMRKSEKCTTE